MDVDQNLWWLPPKARVDELFAGLGYTEPLRAEDGLGDLIKSLDANGPSEREILYPLSRFAWWRKAWYDENVYRTLRLFDRSGRPTLLGPFYLDIDGDDVKGTGPDLEGALGTARDAVETLSVSPNDIRIWFTGHKGFNVEIRPSAVHVSDGRSWAALHQRILGELKEIGLRGWPALANNYVRPNVVVDRIFDRFNLYEPRHTHLRLAGSKNVWLAADGSKRWRVKREVSLDELFSKDAIEIAGVEQS